MAELLQNDQDVDSAPAPTVAEIDQIEAYANDPANATESESGAATDREQAAQAAMASAADARARIEAVPDAAEATADPNEPRGLRNQDPTHIRLHRGLAYVPGEEDPYIVTNPGRSEAYQRFSHFMLRPDDTSHPNRGVRALKRAWKAYATVTGVRYMVRGIDTVAQKIVKKRVIDRYGEDTFKQEWLSQTSKLTSRKR